MSIKLGFILLVLGAVNSALYDVLRPAVPQKSIMLESAKDIDDMQVLCADLFYQYFTVVVEHQGYGDEIYETQEYLDCSSGAFVFANNRSVFKHNLRNEVFCVNSTVKSRFFLFKEYEFRICMKEEPVCFVFYAKNPTQLRVTSHLAENLNGC